LQNSRSPLSLRMVCSHLEIPISELIWSNIRILWRPVSAPPPT
jgi:hypothetical protein